MAYYGWITVNVLFIMITGVYIWIFQPYDSATVLTGLFFAQIAVLLFIINLNMYFIFLVIRKSKIRKVKIALSKLSRKMMKVHIPTAIIATSLIIIHASIMIVELGGRIGFAHPKMVTGYIGMTMLSLTILGGVRRHKKASGFRRRFHLVMAMIFGIAFLLHLFFPM